MAKPPRPDRNRPDAGACCNFFAMRTNGRRFLKRGCSRPVVCRSTGNGAFAFTPITRNGRRGLPIQNFRAAGYNTIEVPGSWQMQGYGVPQYCNMQYPWEGKEEPVPPYAPVETNPVGCYLKSFQLPVAWAEKRVFLRFEGVESAFYLLSMGTGSAMRRILLAPQNLS